MNQAGSDALLLSNKWWGRELLATQGFSWNVQGKHMQAKKPHSTIVNGKETS